jgi:predicted Zn-dependent protease with MMP-like domain
MPLLREWHETGVKLEELVRHIVIHEVGHHFGLSDEEMAALERQAG